MVFQYPPIPDFSSAQAGPDSFFWAADHGRAVLIAITLPKMVPPVLNPGERFGEFRQNAHQKSGLQFFPKVSPGRTLTTLSIFSPFDFKQLRGKRVTQVGVSIR